MSEKISKLDSDVFELIWEAGRKKAMKDGDKSFKRTKTEEMKSCEKENPLIQQLQNTYQQYLKSPNKSNKDVVSNLVTFIKNPTQKNKVAYEESISKLVNVRV